KADPVFQRIDGYGRGAVVLQQEQTGSAHRPQCRPPFLFFGPAQYDNVHSRTVRTPCFTTVTRPLTPSDDRRCSPRPKRVRGWRRLREALLEPLGQHRHRGNGVLGFSGSPSERDLLGRGPVVGPNVTTARRELTHVAVGVGRTRPLGCERLDDDGGERL